MSRTLLGEVANNYRYLLYGLISAASSFALASESPVDATASSVITGETHLGSIERLDARIDDLLLESNGFEVVAEGFQWLEGPAWNKAERYLLFSDIPNNAIYRWDKTQGATLFLKPSGYTGQKPFAGKEPGSNGLTFDSQGRLIICQHGNRRIVRVEPDGEQTVLADHYQGQRLNSPNDVVLHSNGDLYFTDPPFGLPDTFKDTGKELAFSGVYKRTQDGQVVLLTDRLKAPNGIAFSPDEKTLYISDVDTAKPAWWVFDVLPNGNLSEGIVFFDASHWQGSRKGGPDGIEVDRHGYIYGAGPEGIYVFAPDGTHMATFFTGVPTGNLEWGDDGSVLYVTADTRVLRIRLNTRGAHYSQGIRF